MEEAKEEEPYDVQEEINQIKRLYISGVEEDILCRAYDKKPGEIAPILSELLRDIEFLQSKTEQLRAKAIRKYRCALTNKLMKKPVRTSDGKYYDRSVFSDSQPDEIKVQAKKILEEGAYAELEYEKSRVSEFARRGVLTLVDYIVNVSNEEESNENTGLLKELVKFLAECLIVLCGKTTDNFNLTENWRNRLNHVPLDCLYVVYYQYTKVKPSLARNTLKCWGAYEDNYIVSLHLLDYIKLDDLSSKKMTKDPHGFVKDCYDYWKKNFEVKLVMPKPEETKVEIQKPEDAKVVVDAKEVAGQVKEAPIKVEDEKDAAPEDAKEAAPDSKDAAVEEAKERVPEESKEIVPKEEAKEIKEEEKQEIKEEEKQEIKEEEKQEIKEEEKQEIKEEEKQEIREEEKQEIKLVEDSKKEEPKQTFAEKIKAYEEAKANRKFQKSVVCLVLGKLYLKVNDNVEAFKAFEALDLRLLEKSTYAITEYRRCLGLAFIKEGRLIEAEENFNEALRILDSKDYELNEVKAKEQKLNKATILQDLGRMHWANGKIDKAEEELRMCINLRADALKFHVHHPALVSIYLDLSRLYLQQGQAAQAKDFCQGARHCWNEDMEDLAGELQNTMNEIEELEEKQKSRG